MQDVPKIVLKRLQETQSAGIHPDADLLTAFAERSLVVSERARVTEHLSRCSDCREVVALALPATELVAVAASTGPTRTRWFSWPALRWSVAVAGIVAITSIGIVQYRQRQKSDTLVSSLTQPNETAAPAEQALPPSPVAPESQADISQTEKEDQARLKRKALSSRADNLAENRFARPANSPLPAARGMNGAPSRSVTGGSVRFGAAGVAAPKAAPSSPRNTFAVAGASKNTTLEAAKSAPSPSALQAVEVPSSSQTVEVVQSGAAATAPTAKQQDSDHLVEKQKDKVLQHKSSTNSEVRDAKKPATPQSAFSDTSALESALTERTSPQWSINADGALQRSFDAGNTWVDVNLDSELVSNSSNRASTAESAHRPENKKKKVEAQPNPVFRTLSAQGTEVWAGGSAAVLYHSADSGDHWARVLPSSSGATLTGDITSVEFSDPLHGRIATSSGEVWITADDGQTWRRQ